MIMVLQSSPEVEGVVDSVGGLTNRTDIEKGEYR